jgi:PII-like signaling protein
LANTAPGLAMRIYIGSSDQWHGKPLYAAIVQEARMQGLAGATVERGIMGYGAPSAIHETRLLQLSGNLPIVVEIVDAPEKIRDFLPQVEAMMSEGIIATWETEIIALSH